MKKSKNNNIILGFSFWFQLMQRKDHKNPKTKILCSFQNVSFRKKLFFEINKTQIFFSKKYGNIQIIRWLYEFSVLLCANLQFFK